MGVFEKLKNALFEEEIVEVEEKPKKPKTKDFFKDRKVEKPIAKKVVLPEKREHRIEELDEEELLDEDFEIKPVQKEEKVESQTNFDITEDDFKVEEDIFDEPVVEEVKPYEREEKYERDIPREEPKYYQSKSVEKVPYGLSSNTKIGVSEYGGAYEKKDSRTHFTPSPIISPIYGILDKNYKKEDVVQKKEVRLTSSYSRSNLNLDDVRKKAYGSGNDELEKEFLEEPVLQKAEHPFKLDENNDVNLLVDLSEDEKPAVKEVTMGDALEYFNDLGLEYNVDYVDASKDMATGRRLKDNYDEDSHDEKEKENTRVSRLDEEKVESKVKEDIDSDDNLFDLIDSMYKDNE